MPPVKDKQTLTADELRAEAADAVKASGLTRAALADTLGVTPSAITFALNPAREASRYVALLARIVAEVTDFEVDLTPGYTVRRRG